MQPRKVACQAPSVGNRVESRCGVGQTEHMLREGNRMCSVSGVDTAY